MKPFPLTIRNGLRACAYLLALSAAAAPWDAASTSWVSGAAHPVFEFTHIGALLILGFAAAQLGGRCTWGLPVMFAALLGAGIVLGTQGAVAPMLDTIIMTSVLCLVLLILASVHVVFAIITTAVGAFALFHGVADGMGMVQGNADMQYVAGYFLVNLAIMIVGVLIGEPVHHWVQRRHTAWSEHLHHWFGHFHGFKFGH